ncbi:hypothetical protein EDD11_000925 [Mortierella claussenii]|nr:hypothetical protein EDD11_000925 [Mortierella claussenii]
MGFFREMKQERSLGRMHVSSIRAQWIRGHVTGTTSTTVQEQGKLLPTPPSRIMESVHQDALTDIVPVRAPTRKNQFTILARATLDNQQVLLQQARTKHDHSAAGDVAEWLNILATDSKAMEESHLLLVHGTLTQSCQSNLLPGTVPHSVASNWSHDRPIHVVDYHERGSLRDCLDRGEFLNATGQGESNWHAKLGLIKDVATALHYIQRNMHGQQYGAISSDHIYVNKDGRALLSWHNVKPTKQDIASGSHQHWRWFSPAALQQLDRALHQKDEGASDLLHLDADDMFSFAMLAWEIATEELPFEAFSSAPELRQGQSINIDRRFAKQPPLPLLNVIEQCSQLNNDKRPSWCAVLASLETITPESLIFAPECNENDSKGLNGDTAIAPVSTAILEQLNKDKTEVVEMMESVLTSTFYRKELPAHLDSITSVTGKRLFREMIMAGTCECFFSLCTSFNTQSDPAFCGVSSLSMVLNALQIDPRRQWRGVWRWYSEEQLDCCASVEVMKQKGITFNQFCCLARCHAKVVAKRADRHTLEEFRRDIQAITSSEGYHMVLSFSRAALGQTGSGHFSYATHYHHSPIGGYHAGEDKVLVLDCARFKYPPFFATVQELWESLLPTDPETGECRGYFLISPTPKQKLEIQRRQLQGLAVEGGSGVSSSMTSASSSSLSLTPSTDSPNACADPAMNLDDVSKIMEAEEDDGKCVLNAIIIISEMGHEAITQDQDDKTPRRGAIDQFLASRIAGHIPELQVRLKTDLIPPLHPQDLESEHSEGPYALISVPARVKKADPGEKRDSFLNLQDVKVGQNVAADDSASGILNAPTHPLRFLGIVLFSIKNEFKGGDRIKNVQNKIFYWKEIK